MLSAYRAQQIFNGTEWLQGHAAIVDNGVIKDVLPELKLPAGIPQKNFQDALLVPAFIDVQVYGAAGKLLSAYPEADSLQKMYEQFSKEGTVLCQPTIATNTDAVVRKCIDAVKEFRKGGGKGVHGLHLEGPWLNAERRGAHIKEWIHRPSAEEVLDLLEYGKDVITMVTIAPEVCSREVIGLLREHQIVISAGHSNATYAEAMGSFENGVSAVTHLYNAMSPLHHRAPGLVGATLDHYAVMSSIIPDGHHVDYAAIAIAKKIMGERLFAITDAVTETAIGPYPHQLAGDKYESNGILSGSAISMHQAFCNLVQQVGIDMGEALRMCSLYPAKLLKLDHRYGKIVPGYAGQFVVMNKQLQLVDVIT